MADQIKKLSAGHSIEVLDAIMTEVEEARGEHDNLGERLDEMSSDTPTPSTGAPAMDGTAAAGTSTDYARADHVHPSDTSRASAASEAEDRAALIELVDGGAKNLINVGVPRTETLTDVVFTINSDGTVDATTTTATAAERILWFYNDKTKMPDGIEAGKTYCFYNNSGTSNLGIDVWNSTNGTSWNSHFIANVGTYLVATIPANSVGLGIRLLVPSGTTLDDVKAYPMVCTKAAWDISHEYQPYRPSYQELYEMVKALQPAT